MEKIIPQSLKQLQKHYKVDLKVDDPVVSENAGYLFYESALLDSQEKNIKLELILNTKNSNEYEINAVWYKNCGYSDISSEELVDVIKGILENRMIVKKSFLKRKEKICIVDNAGNITYTPRVVY